MSRFLSFFCCLGLLLTAPPTTAQAKPAPPNYSDAIAPLLAKYCAGCHNDAEPEGDFSAESYASLMLGIGDQPTLLPGDPDGSRLLRVITGAAQPQMPPDGEPRPTADEIALLRSWIEAGAADPDGAEPDRLALNVPKIKPHLETRPITAIAVSSDGALLAVGRYGEVALYAAPDGAEVQLGEPLRVIQNLPGKVTALSFVANDQQLLTASGVSGRGGAAALWNVADGALLREFRGHHDLLYDAELSPDGRTLATCSYDKTIRLWNAATGELLHELTGHNGAVYDVAFHPSSEFLVSASADDTCKIWRVADGERFDTLAQPLKEAYCCLFTADGGHILAAGADKNIRVWRFVARDKPGINPMTQAAFAHEGPIVQLRLGADGQLISVAEDRTAKQWDASGLAAGAPLRELQLWPEQPAVAMAAALDPARGRLLLGRLDGTLTALPLHNANQPIAADEPQSAAVEPTTMPLERPVVKLAEQEPNNTPAEAAPVALPAEITGAIADAGDVDLYRFSAKAGETWLVEVNAARSKSPLDSFIEVLDANGQRIERVLLQAVRESYFTFRGKNSDTNDDFRVFNWEEMQLGELLYANGEVAKLWLHPRGPDSGFMVASQHGKRIGFFDTTPLAHALGEPCYIVVPHAPGASPTSNGLPVFPLYYENDDDALREFGRDSRLFFTAPADGEYLVRLRDVRSQGGPEYKYTLTIRPPKPDFRVSAPDVQRTIAPGEAGEFRVRAQRMDGYDGPIHVEVDGLPPGFHATTPILIEAGQFEAFGVLRADADAPPPTPENAAANTLRATAIIHGQEVTHGAGSLGELKLGETPKIRIRIQPAPNGVQPLAGGDDGQPLEFEIRRGQTIMLQAEVERRDFDAEINFGKEGAGRNLPFGVYVDNIGLNGLLVRANETTREFFITADPVAEPQTRLFHLRTGADGGRASPPVLLHVRD